MNGMRTSLVVALLALGGLGGLSAAIAPAVATSVPVTAQTTSGAPAVEVVDIVMRFTAADGTPLEAKLTVPADAKGPVPVVFQLHGAGPRNYDHGLQYRDPDGQVQVYRYYDFHSHELARRGVAFFRMSKRGCTVEPSGRPLVDRGVFSKATMSVLLDDYAQGLDALRQRKEIDASRIVLSGSSEGTRLAPELAVRSPGGIVGIALASYAADNAHDTVVWQNSVGPWRAIQKLIPAAADDALTKGEYDVAVKDDATLASRLPFASFDSDGDGVMTPAETAGVVRPRLDAILKAVEERNDDFIWQAVVNLSSPYLLGWWDAAPNYVTLLKLNIPIGIFHGELDGATRVEGVRETEAAFRAAGKTNLTAHIYPGHDHDLNWTVEASKNGGPVPFLDLFKFAADLVRPR
jgi:pimeloyl-ACP methyl ester carboxylesterase